MHPPRSSHTPPVPLGPDGIPEWRAPREHEVHLKLVNAGHDTHTQQWQLVLDAQGLRPYRIALPEAKSAAEALKHVWNFFREGLAWH